MTNNKKSIKTIKLCVYFHTSGSGMKLEPKTAFKEGWVSMPTNHNHGIRASDVKPIYFGTTQGPLMNAIQKCLKENSIRFVNPAKSTELRKYLHLKESQEFYEEELDI